MASQDDQLLRALGYAGMSPTDAQAFLDRWATSGPASGSFAMARIELMAWLAKPDTTVGAWTRGVSSTQMAYLLSSGAQNDEAVWWLPLGPGTYDLTVAYQTSVQAGIYTFAADDGLGGAFTTLTTVDSYAGGTTDQQAVVTGLVVTGNASRRKVRIKALTKNASSANFFLSLHGFIFNRTA